MFVAQVGECNIDMQRRGVSAVLVEQKLEVALKVSTRVCVMGDGRIDFEGSPSKEHKHHVSQGHPQDSPRT